VLLHVVDAASPLADEQMAEVERVLEDIGAERIPQILVFNKLDLIEADAQPRVLADAIERAPGVVTPRVFVSAKDGRGLDVLRQHVADKLAARLNGSALPTLSDLSLHDPLHGAA
jgi:GTPase